VKFKLVQRGRASIIASYGSLNIYSCSSHETQRYFICLMAVKLLACDDDRNELPRRKRRGIFESIETIQGAGVLNPGCAIKITGLSPWVVCARFQSVCLCACPLPLHTSVNR
jgi:hypothetical protein